MESIFRICLFLSGVINLLPTILVFLPKKIASTYGINVPDINLELLLRHRGVLFGIIGGMMIYSALTKKYYSASFTIGMISMISFVILYYMVDGTVNNELKKVMLIDLIGIAILSVGFSLFKLKQ